MSRVVHLLKDGTPPLLVSTLARQIAAGDRVTLVLLDDAECAVPTSAVDVRRVPDELDYGGLLELVFEADQVVAW